MSRSSIQVRLVSFDQWVDVDGRLSCWVMLLEQSGRTGRKTVDVR